MNANTKTTLTPGPKPAWLKRRLPSGPAFERVRSLIADGRLHTVCQEAQCPNIWECFSSGTATFLILGDRCTRDCRFCAVQSGPDQAPDPREPMQVAQAAQTLKLEYVVITSVTRDDLPDGGAAHFAATISKIRQTLPQVHIEVLIPDFQGDAAALRTVVKARPDVLNHNLETVPRLYPTVRPQADYQCSLQLLQRARKMAASLSTKSGLMLGLGETDRELEKVLADLLRVGCRMLTLGQYLQPSRQHLPVREFVTPERFEDWRRRAMAMGFDQVASAPLVRSSYHAKQLYLPGGNA
jgi:lipoic acid synthetase